mgnify:CR=1 FL=1
MWLPIVYKEKKMIKLVTDNFLLRPLLPNDINATYLGWLRDREVSRTLDVVGHKQTIATITEYLSTHDNKSSFLFGIFTKNDRLIGTHSFVSSFENRVSRLGVMVGDKSFWGMGVPLETRAAILDWAFENMPCDKFESGCYSINIPAVYNFIKQGWVREGIREKTKIIDGNAVDFISYAMFKEKWYAIK